MWQLGQKGLGNYELQSPPRPGVIAFITGSSFIRDISFGGMRSYFREYFDELYIVDLGGDSYAGLDDPNVFVIQSPVAITIGITRGEKNPAVPAKINYLRLLGTKAEKLNQLTNLTLDKFETVLGHGTQTFVHESVNRLSQQPYLAEFFVTSSTGCLPGRSWVASPSLDVLNERWDLLLRVPLEEKDEYFRVGENRNARSKPLGFKTHRPVPSIVELPEGTSLEDCIQYSYRPFDHQYLIRDPRVLGQPSIFIQHLNDNQIYFGSGGSLSGGPSVLAFPNVPDKHAFNGRGGKDFYPRLNTKDGSSNLSSKALEFMTKLSNHDPEAELIGYIYGIHGSGSYFEVFRDDLGLGLDRARLPLTSDRNSFHALSEIGLALLNIHTGQSRFAVERKFNIFQASPSTFNNVPTKISYSRVEQAIFFDEEMFCSIPSEIWEFRSNGIHVVKSWLDNRKAEPKGKRTSPLDQINEKIWKYNEEFVKMIGDVSAVLESKKLALPLVQKIAEELENYPGS
jgi:predicted helicase